jgi:hypothetical protein
MALGNTWTVLNLGVRFRQRRDGEMIDTLTGPPTIAFGICSSGDTGPRYGVQTKSVPWTRMSGPLTWWNVQALVSERGPFDTTLRVAESGDIASSWYVRFERISGGLIVTTFLPRTAEGPPQWAFEEQLDQDAWQPSICGHTGYEERQVTLPGSIATLLEHVAVRSTALNYVSSTLRAIEWCDIRPVLIA